MLLLYFMIAVAGIVLAAVLLRYWTSKHTDAKIASYQSDLMEKHCEEVESMYRQTRGWRHDYHNHIQTMKAHLAMGNLDKLETYLNALDEDLSAVDTVIKTGNIMIDAVLNSKISVAREKHIEIDAKALVPKELDISEIDLSVIIGNLMDNAMEACLKIPQEEERFIRIYIDVLKGQLYIYVMNSTRENPKRFGSSYLSTKSDRSHGFGLMRMDKVVGKYNGYLDRQNEQGVFVTEIMLPLKMSMDSFC